MQTLLARRLLASRSSVQTLARPRREGMGDSFRGGHICRQQNSGAGSGFRVREGPTWTSITSSGLTQHNVAQREMSSRALGCLLCGSSSRSALNRCAPRDTAELCSAYIAAGQVGSLERFYWAHAAFRLRKVCKPAEMSLWEGSHYLSCWLSASHASFYFNGNLGIWLCRAELRVTRNVFSLIIIVCSPVTELVFVAGVKKKQLTAGFFLQL